MKLKTLSSAKKRVRITGTGKVIFDKTAKKHLLSQKSKKAKGRDKYGKELSPTYKQTVKVVLPYSI